MVAGIVHGEARIVSRNDGAETTGVETIEVKIRKMLGNGSVRNLTQQYTRCDKMPDAAFPLQLWNRTVFSASTAMPAPR